MKNFIIVGLAMVWWFNIYFCFGADAATLRVTYTNRDVVMVEEGPLSSFRIMIMEKQKHRVPAGLYLGKGRGDFEVYQPLRDGWTEQDMLWLKQRFPDRISK